MSGHISLLKQIDKLEEENQKLKKRVEVLEKVARAAKKCESKFMAIDDGFFTGLVPPEFGCVSAALKALEASDE